MPIAASGSLNIQVFLDAATIAAEGGDLIALDTILDKNYCEKYVSDSQRALYDRLDEFRHKTKAYEATHGRGSALDLADIHVRKLASEGRISDAMNANTERPLDRPRFSA